MFLTVVVIAIRLDGNPTAAKVISGAGTPTITVDSTARRATRHRDLVVDDRSSDPMCRQSAQSVAVVRAPERKVIVAREFDECDNCTFDDQKRGSIISQLNCKTILSARAYIIAYGGR